MDDLNRHWTNRLGRRRLLRGAAIVGGGLAGAVLVGCAGDEEAGAGDADGGGASGDSSPSAGASGVDGEPKRGGHLSTAVSSDPAQLDLHAGSSTAENQGAGPAYNLLVKYDPLVEAEPPDAIIGDLAESWEQSDDGLTFTFTTLTGPKFQNGQGFSSADVKASIERIMDPPEGVVSPRRDQFAPVESIDTPDDTTVVFHMSQPFPSFLPVMAQGWNVIYSQEDIANDFDYQRQVNGTGPFRFQNYQQGNRMELVRNDEYHVEGRPYLDAFTVYIIPDGSTALANFQSGELSLMGWPTLTKSDAESLESALGDQFVLDGPKPGFGFGTINFGPNEPWRDERVRRAVAMVMNKEEAVTLLREDWGAVGGYHAAGGTWALPVERLRELPGYEPVTEEKIAEARSLLDAAGVPEGHEVSLLTRANSSYSEKLSLFVQDQLGAIGIVGTADVLEAASAYDALNTRNFDLAPWSHAYALDDPDAVFAEFYLQGSPRNYSEVGSDEVDDLFAQQTVELDHERRMELVNELEAQALQLYGKVITDWRTTQGGRWAHVQNRLRHFSWTNNYDYQDVWLDT